MLCLTRAIGERIFIGHDVVVTVLEAHGGKARIGVEAPENVPVHREEIYQRVFGKPSAETLPVDGKLLDSGESQSLP